MKILVMERNAKVFSLECESTDTIAHLKAKWNRITSELMFDGKWLRDNLSENMTLADIGIEDGSLILESYRREYRSCPKPRSLRRIPDLMIGKEICIREASSSMGEICIRHPSDSNLSLMGSSTLIGKANRYLSSTMKILVVDETAKVFPLECESTDTIAHLKAKLLKQNSFAWISLCEQRLMFDGKLLGDAFSENMTLADAGVQDGSLTLILSCSSSMWNGLHPSILFGQAQGPGIIERPRNPRRVPEKDYLCYADAFKSGWREEHAKVLLHLLLELCQDGTISEGNVTDEAWLLIQNSLKNSMKCSFEIDFLKERLCDYKQLYSVLTETTSSSIFEWNRERKTITIRSNGRLSDDDDWREEYPELLLLCEPYIPYFDTLEKVCLLVKTTRSHSTNINNAWEACSSKGEICMIL